MPKASKRTLIAPPSLERHIYVIRGQKVMLGGDLATLYGVATKRLNEAVRRNLKRFPDTFMFRLTSGEASSLRSQFATLEKGRGRHPKYAPLAFTEHGVVMLSSVLNSEHAIQMNIMIVNAFIRLREMIAADKDLAVRVGKLETDHRRIVSVIDVLIDEISGIGQDVRHMKKLPAPMKRKIGFDL